MKVAFISGLASDNWGGSEYLWVKSAIALLQQGHRVFASTAYPPSAHHLLDAFQKHGGVLTHRKVARQSLLHTAKIRIAQRAGSWPGYLENNWRKLNSFRPDFICISHGGIACGASWAQRCIREGIPFFNIAQANGERLWPKDSQFQELRDIYGKAICNFFVSHANLELFQSQIGQRLDNSHVVANPVNLKSLLPIPWLQQSEPLRLACVGRIDPYSKGQDLIFEVLATKKWSDRSVALSLYGSGDYELSVRALATYRGIDSKVKFCGFTDSIEQVWENHHALILPSRIEGLPLALVEAMLCGRIVVSTRVAGIPEVVRDNFTGFLAESPTAGHLDAALERAWCNRSNWREMGIAAHKDIKSKMDKDPATSFAALLLHQFRQQNTPSSTPCA